MPEKVINAKSKGEQEQQQREEQQHDIMLEGMGKTTHHQMQTQIM